MKPSRSLSVDALRLLAVLGVIFIHLAPSTPAAASLTEVFSLWAVAFFFSISLYYFVTRLHASRTITIAGLRWERILVPYAIWTAVYIVLRVVKYRTHGVIPATDSVAVVLFGGGAIHLYFLPKLLFLQAVALAIILISRRSRAEIVGERARVVAFTYAWVGQVGGYFGFAEALLGGALFPAGAFLLVRSQNTALGRRINISFAGLFLLLLATTIAGGFPLRSMDGWEAPLAGYALSALALNWQFTGDLPAARFLSFLFSCSYGIYLAHFAFLEALEFVLGRAGYELKPYSIAGKLLLAIVITTCCVVFIVVTRRFPMTACLFLGEESTPPRAKQPLAKAVLAEQSNAEPVLPVKGPDAAI